MIVNIAIITIGVTRVQRKPSTEPRYRAANSRLVSETIRSIRWGSCHRGRQTARRTTCAEIMDQWLAGGGCRCGGNRLFERAHESFHFSLLSNSYAHVVGQSRKSATDLHT